MLKEAGTGTKSNTKKTPKPDKRETDSSVTNKRDASTRSPLEENPEKKLRDVYLKKCTAKETEVNEVDNTSHIDNKENSLETKNPNESDMSSEEMEMAQYPIEDSTQNTLTDKQHYQNTLDILLNELKDLKVSIAKLDAKLDQGYQDLSSKLPKTEELKELIASQNDQIAALHIENKNLKLKNELLGKELLEVQESTLQLKVDVTGISESNYKTYDQL